MHLSSFGLISLDGSVSKLEPGLDFASYQVAMANHSTTIALKSRVTSAAAKSENLTANAAPPESSPAEPPLSSQAAPGIVDPPTRTASQPSIKSAAELVKLFRR